MAAAWTTFGLVPVPIALGGILLLATASRMPHRTAKGTVRLRKVASTGPGRMKFSVVDDALYFVGQSTKRGHELWRSDGTAEGTRPFLDINPAWERALGWLPTFTCPMGTLVIRGTVFAPHGRDAPRLNPCAVGPRRLHSVRRRGRETAEQGDDDGQQRLARF